MKEVLILGNADLERRVTKIENFLKAGNFAKANQSGAKYFADDINSSTTEESKVYPNEIKKPKYQGKTQDYWPKLLQEFKNDGKMFMYINLAGTVAREVNDMTLEIDFPNGMNSVAKEFLSRPDTKQNLKDIIHIACGKEMQIKFVESNVKKENQQSEFEKFIENNDLPFNII